MYIGRLQTDIVTFLVEQVRGKDLLDVGCADHDVDCPPMRERWLHGHLCSAARSTLGLDILEDACRKLRERGFDAIAGDACTIDLGRQFECIVAGEIIEHVQNPGMLVTNLARHLQPGGRLILTTPNAHFGLHMVESVVADPWKRWHPQHVAWFDAFTLVNLMQRCDLRVVSAMHFTRSRRLLSLIRLGLPCWSLLASSVLVIATKD